MENRNRAWLGFTSTLIWAAVIATAGWRLMRSAHGEFSGYDFAPLYGAGLAERLHQQLYAVHNFVYPPFAALVFLPLTVLPYPAALVVYRVLAVGALIATCIAATALTPTHRRPHQPSRGRRWLPSATAGSCALVLLLAHSTARSIGLANASLFLPLVLVACCWSWARGLWSRGTALLVASLIVKPVLLALLVLPIARRRWKDLVFWGGVGGLLSLAALVASAGAQDIPSVVSGLIHASHFRGHASTLNLSIAGMARVHHLPPLVVDLARLATLAWGAVVTARWVVVRERRPRADTATAPIVAVATVLTASLFLVGSISEVHYLLILAPGVIVALRCGSRWPAAVAAGAAFAYLAAGDSHLLRTQELLVAAQVLTLVACSLMLWGSSVQVGSRSSQVLGGQARQRSDQRSLANEEPALGA